MVVLYSSICTDKRAVSLNPCTVVTLLQEQPTFIRCVSQYILLIGSYVWQNEYRCLKKDAICYWKFCTTCWFSWTFHMNRPTTNFHVALSRDQPRGNLWESQSTGPLKISWWNSQGFNERDIKININKHPPKKNRIYHDLPLHNPILIWKHCGKKTALWVSEFKW